MKTKTNLIPSFSHLTSWSALLLAGFALAWTPASVRAGREVPFKASFVTEFTAAPVPNTPLVCISVIGQGLASHLGKTVAVTDNQKVNLATGEATATYTLTGANGDTVVVEMAFQAMFLSQTEVSFEGTYSVVSGTGRFVGANGGSGVLQGSATFQSQSSGVGQFTLVGTISQPGR